VILIAIAGLGLLIFVFVTMYNSLISRNNQVDQNMGSIQAYLKKRADLVPSLVTIVGEYANHEKSLLIEIAELRMKALAPNQTPEQQIEKSDLLSQSVKGLMISIEKYPDLKANKNFLQLQHSISEIEDQLAATRRSYSAAVTNFNNGVEMIPYNFVAGFMGLKKKAVIDFQLAPQNPASVDEMFNKQKRGS
jgi:LemA protein